MSWPFAYETDRSSLSRAAIQDGRFTEIYCMSYTFQTLFTAISLTRTHLSPYSR